MDTTHFTVEETAYLTGKLNRKEEYLTCIDPEGMDSETQEELEMVRSIGSKLNERQPVTA